MKGWIEMLRYREVWRDFDLIGYVAQDENGKVYSKSMDKKFDKILNTFLTPVKVDIANVESSIVSISESKIIPLNDVNWIGYMVYSLPVDYFATGIKYIEEEVFNGSG